MSEDPIQTVPDDQGRAAKQPRPVRRARARAADSTRAALPPRDAGQRRGRVRWVTFFASLPIALALLLAGILGVTLVSVSWVGARAYGKGDYGTSTAMWEFAGRQTVFEAWKAPFGSGTTLLRTEDYARAKVLLQRAYDATPGLPESLAGAPDAAAHPRCMTSHNLALAHEGSADDLVSEARVAVEAAKNEDDPSPKIDEAITLYERAIEDYATAMELRTTDGCPDDATARDREEEKQQTAQDELDALREPPPATDDQEDQNDDSEPPPDSDQPDDEDSSGDSDAEEDNPDDNPESDPDESGPDSDSEAEADTDTDDATPETPEEQQRREELAERQRLAQERAEIERGQMGAPPTRNW